NLQDQFGADRLTVEPRLDLDHRELDQIGGRSLHWRVDRRALGCLAARTAAGIDVRKPEPAPKNGLDISLCACELTGPLHVPGHARVADEILFDELRRGAALDAELCRQPEGAHAVDQSEVHGLDLGQLLRGHIGARTADAMSSRYT